MNKNRENLLGLFFILFISMIFYSSIFPFLGDLFTELVWIFERKLALHTTILLIELLPEIIIDIIYRIVCDLIV